MISPKHALLIILGLTGCYSATYAGNRQQRTDTVYAADHGVVPNTGKNVSAALQRAVQACKTQKCSAIVLPGGRIDLWPDGAASRTLYISNGTESDSLPKVRHIGLLLEDMQHVTIEGKQTLVVLHKKMISFALLGAADVTIRNLRFDYARPTMSEMKITAISSDHLDAVIHPDATYRIDNGRLRFYGEDWTASVYHAVLFKAGSQLMKYSSFKKLNDIPAVEIAPRTIRFSVDFTRAGIDTGDVLTLRDPHRDNSGAFIANSRQVRLMDVTMHYMHGLGIVAQFSKNISYERVRVGPAPGSGRIISSFADAFHFSGCAGQLRVRDCKVSGAHDDPINVHGTHLRITAVQPGKLVVRFMHHQTWGFAAFFAGDSIAIVDPATLLYTGYARVRVATMLSDREMALELEGPSKGIKEGDCVENLSWTPDVEISGCRFERTNTRGILVTTRGKVLIENNVFFRTGMHAILIADDAASWYESGPVRDVLIRRNRFEECGYNTMPGNYVIAIAPENHTSVNGKYVHRNIRIEHNEFKCFDSPLLTAKSVDGLVFSHNTFIPSTLLPGKGTQPAIRLEACRQVVVDGNQSQLPWQLKISLKATTPRELKTGGTFVLQTEKDQ